jgi:hypothetical protein
MNRREVGKETFPGKANVSIEWKCEATAVRSGNAQIVKNKKMCLGLNFHRRKCSKMEN